MEDEHLNENSLEIKIQTFVNPYLFWFCTQKSKLQRNILAKKLAEVGQTEHTGFAEKGQWVLVNDKVLKRASILDIQSFQTKKTYTCWLIDYGTVCVTQKIYHLSTAFVDIPPLVTQACLNNVVFMKEHLQHPSSRDQFSNSVLNFADNNCTSVKLPYPTSGTCFLVSEILFDKNVKIFYFNKENEYKGVQLGDLLYSDGSSVNSLKNTMVHKKLVVIDELFFKNLLQTKDITNKHLHINAITDSNTFKESTSFNEKDYPDVSNRTGSRGITNNYHSNSGSSETGSLMSDTENQLQTFIDSWKDQSQELTKKEILQRRLLAKKKSITPPSKNQVFRNKDCSFESDNSTTSPMKDNLNKSLSPGDTNKAAKRTLLLRLKLQHKDKQENQIENCSTTSNSSLEHSKLSPKNRLLNVKEKYFSDRQSTDSNEPIGNSKTQKHLENTESTVFLPAGANVSTCFRIKSATKTDDDWSESESFNSMDKQKEDVAKLRPQKHLVNTKSTVFMPAGANYSMSSSKNRCTKNAYKKSYINSTDNDWNESESQSSMDRRKESIGNAKRCSNQKSSTYETDRSKNESSDSLVKVVGGEREQTNEITEKSSEVEKAEGNESNTDDEWIDTTGNFQKPAQGGLQIHATVCNCTNCSFWTESTTFDVNTNSTTINPLDVSVRAEPLFKRTEDDASKPIVTRSDFEAHTKIEKIINSAVLTHGLLMTPPRKIVSELPMDMSVQKVLKSMEYQHLKKIQSHALPAILRLHNICLVGPPKSGKTFCYVSYICSLLASEDIFYKDLNKFKGPKIIILCCNSQQCEDVYDYFKVFLSKLDFKTRIVTATYPLKFTNLKLDILITIPEVLIDLCKVNLINFKRLCHIVLENVDVLLEKHKTSLMKILSLADNMLSHRFCDVSIQLIGTSEKWTSNIENLLKDLRELPTVCISNPLEAVVYGKVEFNINFLESDYKLHCLNEILKNKYKIYKTIVLCNADETEIVENYLQREGIDIVTLHENCDSGNENEYIDLEQKWTSQVGGEYLVLLCTDEIFNRVLTVTNANMLVHYSLSTKWSTFKRRFSALIDNISSPLCQDEDKKKCVTYILADENCAMQVPKFLEFLKRMNQPIPENFQHYLKAYKLKKEQHKLAKNISLCPALKLFGSCENEHCHNRHIVDGNLDVKGNLPQNGRVKFQILELKDVTNYTVKLIEHRDLDNNVHVFDDSDFEELELELAQCMKVEKTSVKQINLNEMYVYRNSNTYPETFNRCQVLTILDDNRLEIILVDKFRTLQIELADLYELPGIFKNISCRVVDVYVSNFIPPYKDEHFSNRCFTELKRGLLKEHYTNIVFTADICLQLSNSLWIKNVTEEVNLKDVTVTKFNLSKYLCNSKLVVIDSNQLAGLYNLCAECGIDLPKYEKPRKVTKQKKDAQLKPNWAFLESDVCHEVVFAAGLSPGEFYIKLRKYEDLLATLQEELKESLLTPHSQREVDVEVGKCYIAQDPVDGEYCRVIVQERNETEALCFFVDFGDESKIPLENIKHIPNHLIMKLPFQAILCRLHGLVPVLNDWQEEATDILYKYAYEPDSDILRTFYVQACQEEKVDNRKMYSIIFKDSYGPKNVMINKIILDCGLALPKAGEELHDFEIPLPAADEIDELSGDENKIEVHKRDLQEYENPEETDMYEGLVFYDVQKFADALFNADKEENAQPVVTKQKSAGIPAIKATEPVDYLTPEVYWSQTQENIKMHIKIAYVKEECYSVKLSRGRFFNLDAIVDERKYCLPLILFEVVDKSFQHSLVGSEIRVVIKKIAPVEWPRLVMTRDRLRNIHYDLNTLQVEEEKKEIPLDLRDISDEESSGKEDDVKYWDITDSSSGGSQNEDSD